MKIMKNKNITTYWYVRLPEDDKADIFDGHITLWKTKIYVYLYSTMKVKGFPHAYENKYDSVKLSSGPRSLLRY